ncbi:MAG: hypothetical protein KDB21_02375, partial [Acidimicrobiales bacterium]|nr:hypothetical protein [Acidimicrobiales bacterium]
MGRKLVGVLLAVGLVSLGMLVRSLVSSGGDDESADGATIYCVPELAEACRRSAGDAEVVVEDAADTFDRLVVRDAPEAVWVTMAPWPAMVDDERRRSGLSTMFDAASLTDGSAAAAVSPLEWVGWTERLDVLEADCGLTWECVADGDRWADHGGPSSWGRVNLGLEDPSVTTYTLAAVGSASGVFDGARV